MEKQRDKAARKAQRKLEKQSAVDGEPLIDPESGEPVTDPESGEPVADSESEQDTESEQRAEAGPAPA